MGSLVGKGMIIALGLFTLLGGVCNWDFFMNHRKAQFFIKLFGRAGARLFYCVLGGGIVFFGIAWVAGFVNF